jgi:hypothetical protein
VAIGNFNVSGAGSGTVWPGSYWSSSDDSANGGDNASWFQRFSDGYQGNNYSYALKYDFLSLRCVRR